MENSTGTISFGEQTENPLSLLGQYSDDELDERSNETSSAPDDSVVDDDNQTKDSVGKPVEEGEVGGSEDIAFQKVDNKDLERDSASASYPQIVEADAVISNVAALNENGHEENQDPVREASDTQTTGDVLSCWKMVLHEESNRYYYWNTVTGETSWEVPDALAQGTGMTNQLETLGAAVKESAAGDINASSTVIGSKLDDFAAGDGVGYGTGVSEIMMAYEHGVLANQTVEQCESDGSQLMGSSAVVGALPYASSTLGSYSLSEQVNAGGGPANYEVHGDGAMVSEQCTTDLPLHLVKQCEALLEKMKLLHGSRADSDQQDSVSKFIIEIEIRLSDLRSLLPYGLSLVPFWLHSERQLNQLESAINSEIEKNNSNINGSHFSAAEGKDAKLKDTVGVSKVDEDMTMLPPESAHVIAHDVVTSAVVQKSSHESSDGGFSNMQRTSVDGHPADLHPGEEAGEEINGTMLQGKASPKPELQSGEDIDMDIDMEVEDASPDRNTVQVDVGCQLVTPLEQRFVQPIGPTVGQSLEPGSEFTIPPPPDEEWIPPPPPDNEEIPPPPPDEPPESLCPPPPSEPEPVQPIYSEQYTMTYTEPNVSYYGNTGTEATGTGFYEPADGNQIAALNLPVYYATVSNAQPTAMPNPADTTMYYGIQNGVAPIVPLDSTAGSSSFQAVSSHLNCDPPSSNQIATVDTSAAEASSLSSTTVVSAPSTVSVKEYVAVASFSAPATTSVTAASTSASISDASAAVPKAQSKAVRTKKPKVAVSSSLRSNKKVSSLVDKWKAAKEELQEEEEEQRETPLENLERKRQRQIEEWRAQQIASGEAKENANFQPLGGDWRERVKRRRAQKAVSETSPDAADGGAKQPDLNELSKDLPSGWQAYWDDSSRQVYYGNSITSETSWTRPTR